MQTKQGLELISKIHTFQNWCSNGNKIHLNFSHLFKRSEHNWEVHKKEKDNKLPIKNWLSVTRSLLENNLVIFYSLIFDFNTPTPRKYLSNPFHPYHPCHHLPYLLDLPFHPLVLLQLRLQLWSTVKIHCRK